MGIDPIVETSYGKLRGTTDGGVLVFRGVPFAQPPVGARRFQVPLPPQPWPGVRAATDFAPAALQGADPLPLASESDASGCSEDCLTLNVWTPSLDGARRPVLVWIHGGSFLRGSASMRALNGARLAHRGDVVVVAIQYRLGIFGFLYLNELCGDATTFPANLALRDQIAALQWVRAEIGAFGGDANNVTVFGQSAGAISAGVLLATPAAQGLFDRVILQSGPPGVFTAAQAKPVSEALINALGLRPRELRRLSEVSADQLLAVEAACAAAPGQRPLGMLFSPVVDGDILPQHPLEAIRGGMSKHVPLLIGSNADEMTPFLFVDPSIAALDEAALLERGATIMPGSAVSRAVEIYTQARRARGLPINPSALWLALKADRYVRHPSMRVAELQRAHQGPSYSYLFTWESPSMGGMLGACHGLELPFVFGTLDMPILTELTGGGPAAELLSQHMQDAWLAFARGDAPGHQGLGPWPRYGSQRRATMLLGRDHGVVDAPMEEERRFWDEVSG
jgi:para-nitrobenzyl esterase